MNPVTQYRCTLGGRPRLPCLILGRQTRAGNLCAVGVRGTTRVPTRRVRHFNQPGECHELTFSCYCRMALLTNDDWREKLSPSIDRAMAATVGCSATTVRPASIPFRRAGARARNVRHNCNLAGRSYSRLITSIKAPGSMMRPPGIFIPSCWTRIARPVFKADSQNRSGVVFGSTWQARA
jgi:hypothetical protein